VNDIGPVARDPRWGQVGRDRKAEAILATLQRHCRCELTDGAWLDLGCGSGGISATLASHVKHVTGVDPEPWRRWDAFRAEHANLEFHAGSYHQLEGLIGRESCDVVVCNQVYEHVDDACALLAEIYRVLKPDGVCYFAGPNLLWPIEPHVFWPFVHWLPRAFAQRSMRALGSKQAQGLDAWSWSYWRLTRAFRDAGFVYASAIRDRLQSDAGTGGKTTARVLGNLPESLFSMLTPFSPAFVFVLRRRASVHS